MEILECAGFILVDGDRFLVERRRWTPVPLPFPAGIWSLAKARSRRCIGSCMKNWP